jgi:hypothetical protein
MKDTNKLERVLKGMVDAKNGNRVRQITNAIVKRYVQNPEELKDYFFHPNELVQGVATGAYAMITGDLGPALSKEYGGLGATLDYTKLGLSTSRKQLHFAKLLGTALCKSNNSGFSLWFAETYGNSLGGSKNSEDALAYAKTHENSLTESENTGRALLRTENRGNSLFRQQRMGFTLFKKLR